MRLTAALLFASSVCQAIMDSEKSQVDQWIKENNLNEYGDVMDTMYPGGNPLYNEMTGEIMDKYDYITAKNRAAPWLTEGTVHVMTDYEKKQVDQWIEVNHLNQYGDSIKTAYIGCNPLFDESTGRTKDKYEYIAAKHRAAPWQVEIVLEDIQVMSEFEKKQVDKWIKSNHLNEYGDSVDTMYPGGNPLFDERSGETMDKYTYIAIKNKATPWRDVKKKSWWKKFRGFFHKKTNLRRAPVDLFSDLN